MMDKSTAKTALPKYHSAEIGSDQTERPPFPTMATDDRPVAWYAIDHEGDKGGAGFRGANTGSRYLKNGNRCIAELHACMAM